MKKMMLGLSLAAGMMLFGAAAASADPAAGGLVLGQAASADQTVQQVQYYGGRCRRYQQCDYYGCHWVRRCW